MTETGKTKTAKGADGEKRAAAFLEKNGYAVLVRNYRFREGEVDIIAYKSETLVFAEVKTWAAADVDMLAAALGKEKQQRIIKTAKRFLLEYRQYSNSYVRFDVLLVDMFGEGEIRHIENAFSEFL